MWKVSFAVLVVLLPLCLPAFCEEKVTSHRSFAVGFGLGQRAGDVSASLNITSPYIHFKLVPHPRSLCAIRISGDLRYKNEIPDGQTIESLMPYYAARLGFVGTADVSNLIRMYEEIGVLSVFPTTELASSTKPRVGLYGYIGSEVLLGKNLLTRSTSIFMEIGIESLYAEHRFDKLANRPLMGWGATVGAGGRFYL